MEMTKRISCRVLRSITYDKNRGSESTSKHTGNWRNVGKLITLRIRSVSDDEWRIYTHRANTESAIAGNKRIGRNLDFYA